MQQNNPKTDLELEAMYNMASKFMDYTGPKTRKAMSEFANSNPAVGAKLGSYQQAMKQMTQPVQMNEGGVSYYDDMVPAFGETVMDTMEPVEADVDTISAASNQLLSSTTGQADSDAPSYDAAQPNETALASRITQPEAETYTATQATEEVKAGLEDTLGGGYDRDGIASKLGGEVDADGNIVTKYRDMFGRERTRRESPENAYQRLLDTGANVAGLVTEGGARGQVSDEAQVEAAQGELSPEAKAVAATASPETIDKVEAQQRIVGDNETAEAIGRTEEAVKTDIAEATKPDTIRVAQTSVSPNEIPEPAQIRESEMAQAASITAAGLTSDATATAAKLKQFTVDDGTLAEFKEGKIEAQDTVQGQLASLMQSFDDGTPAWAAGAMRAANAAMAARGLGSSSMAGAAIVQAAMESALPIAQADAQAFQQMKLSNLNRQQQVALANAAAAQGVELANFNAEQQAALQNSQNAFSLQSQNLSNMQQVVLANAQIKSALQGQNLNNQQQANLATAARYAEANNINLSNRQQGVLQDSANNMTTEMANLSNKQQAYMANAQLEAALQGKVIDNEQQVAILNAAKFSEAANITFTAEQQAQIHNSELMKTVGLAELNTAQAATLQNAAQIASMDMANLNNRQQAQVQNAKAFLEMDMSNLTNEQQATMFKAQAIQQSILSDQAADNAAKQFNASSENQVNQYFAGLKAQTSQFNASQKNAMSQFMSNAENAERQFNATMQSQREEFNAKNSLVVAQANAQWRQDIATLNTAAQNEANMQYAKSVNNLTESNIDAIWQRERDLMSYNFTSEESAKDRALSILMADKEMQAVKDRLGAQEDAAKTELAFRFLFGSSFGGLF